MNFIQIENLEKKLYKIKYNKYLEWFLSDKNLLISVSSKYIIFQADNLQPLHTYIGNKFLTELFINKFIYDLGSQILFLKDMKYVIPFFSLSDIIIINNNNFLFINPNNLFMEGHSLSFNEKDNPALPDKLFIAPELEKKNIPVSYACSYYSLAKLILYIFNFKLDSIYYTSIYFFLKRCLVIDPTKRDFLFI